MRFDQVTVPFAKIAVICVITQELARFSNPDAERLVTLLGVRPDQYRDFAALRGDPSDNLPGVRGIGPKTAARLLAAFDNALAAFDDLTAVAQALGPAVAARLAAQEARATWELNCQVMAMRADVAVDLSGGAGALPLPSVAVQTTFGSLDLPWTAATALRAGGLEEADAMKVTGHQTAYVFRNYDMGNVERLRAAMDQARTLAAERARFRGRRH
jgi:hypothetical protein